MKTKWIQTIICLALLSFGLGVYALTDEQAADLAARFIPAVVANRAQGQPYGDAYVEDIIANPLEQIQYGDYGHLRYLAFTMPGDTAQYVILGWGSTGYEMFWRLLKSTDGGATYTVWQDAPCWISGDNFHFRLQDLTNDGIPEILIEEDDELNVYAWRSGRMVCISPSEPDDVLSACESSGFFGADVFLKDFNGDGVAEVVATADGENRPDEDGNYTFYPLTPTRIYKYDGSKYVLWKEIPYSDTDPFAVTVPALGVAHPGTIPLSELEAQGGKAGKAKGGGGNSALQVFVSHPGASNTVDDIDATKFTYKETAISFKKRWPNNKHPDVNSANQDWNACPVVQTASQSNGEWNPGPEDPWMPSPDGKYEYHFVGPYLELRLPRSVVFPDLLAWSEDFFSKNPDKEVYWASIPIDGMMKNGKLLYVDCTVCVKKTGHTAKKSAAVKKPPAASSSTKKQHPQ